MSGNFPYRRAALILAEAQFRGVKGTITRHAVSRGTYDFWLQRLKNDDKLKKLYQEFLEKITSSWQAEALQTLKAAMEVTCLGLKNNPFQQVPKKEREKEIWGKNMAAMANVLKTIGDLNISTFVLMEDSEEENLEEE